MVETAPPPEVIPSEFSKTPELKVADLAVKFDPKALEKYSKEEIDDIVLREYSPGDLSCSV